MQEERPWGLEEVLVSITNSCTFRTPFCFLVLVNMMSVLWLLPSSPQGSPLSLQPTSLLPKHCLPCLSATEPPCRQLPQHRVSAAPGLGECTHSPAFSTGFRQTVFTDLARITAVPFPDFMLWRASGETYPIFKSLLNLCWSRCGYRKW